MKSPHSNLSIATWSRWALMVLACSFLVSAKAGVTVPTTEGATELPELDENSIETVIYVDVKKGSPQASGDKSDPFSGLGVAMTAARNSLAAGKPTKIILAPGIYREDVRYVLHLKEEDDPNIKETLLVLEGEKAGEVIFSGSEVDGWEAKTWKEIAPGIYEHEWPYETEPYPGPWINSYGFALLPGLSQRSEMLWIHGRTLRQILSEKYKWEDPDGSRTLIDEGSGKTDPNEKNEDGSLKFDGLALEDPKQLPEPYTFAVYTDPQSPEHLRGKIFVRLPEDLPIAKAGPIEVGDWIKHYAPLMVIGRKENLILRNLAFTHNANGPLFAALILNECKNFILEDCDFSQNGAFGLNINKSASGIVRRCTANDNLGNGMSLGRGTRHVLLEDCETSFNSIRGGWSGWQGWHASGFKSGQVHHITYRRHVSIGNYANGLWLDVYCTHILTENSFLMGNRRMGLMYEFTRPNGGPQVVRDTITAFNDGTGIYITMAANTVVENCISIKNGKGYIENEETQSQLHFKFRDRQGGPNNAEEWEACIVKGNIFASDQGELIGYIKRKSDPQTQYDRVLRVLSIGENQYWLPNQDDAFRLPSGESTDLDGWRALLAEYDAPPPRDSDSKWEKPDWAANPRDEFTAASQSAITKKAREMKVPLPQARIKEYWERVDAGLYQPPHYYWNRKQYD